LNIVDSIVISHDKAGFTILYNRLVRVGEKPKTRLR
jgi:hypothetical protein